MISTGNSKRKKSDVSNAIQEHISKICKPIFDNIPAEAVSNRMSVGHFSSKKKPSKLSLSSFNNHNYRLYFVYEKAVTKFTAEGRLGVGYSDDKGSVGGGRLVSASSDEKNNLVIGCKSRVGFGRFCNIHLKNHDSEIEIEDSKTGSRITIKKKIAEVRYKDIRKWHIIDNSKPKEIENLRRNKRKAAIKLFREFVKVFGGKSDFKPIKEYCLDNALTDNCLTNRQRIKDKFETEVVKKVYGEKKLEYKSTKAAINAAHNAGLYDFSPEIAAALTGLDAKLTPAIDALAKQIELHLAVQQDQLYNQKVMNKSLNTMTSALLKLNKMLSRFK